MTIPISRRTLLGKAVVIGVGLSVPSMAVRQRRGAAAMRGMGTRNRLPTDLGGGTSWCNFARVRRQMPIPFQRIQIVYPTFRTSTGAGSDIAAAMRFQAALEYPYAASLTGLTAPRKPFTFCGQLIGIADPTVLPFPAHSASDIMDFGSVIPAYTDFGMWSCNEFSAKATPAFNRLPYNDQAGSDRFATYEKAFLATTSYIDTSWTTSATTIATPSTSQPFQCLSPFMLVDCGPGTASVIVQGDSITRGVDEGAYDSGSAADGDARGDVNGNTGWVERWINKYLPGVGMNGFGQASDRLAYRATAGNNNRQLAFAKVLNPTHLVIQLGSNDIASSSGIGTMTDALNAIISDYRTALGWQIPAIGSVPLPQSTSTDKWTAADASDQSPQNGFGLSSVASRWAQLVRLRDASLGLSGVIDPAKAMEYGAENSGLNQSPGMPRYWTYDGTHPTSTGYEKIATYLRDNAGNPFAK